MVLINGINYAAASPVVKRLAPDQYVPKLSNQPTPVTAPAPTATTPVPAPVSTPSVPTPAPLPVAPIATTIENTMTPEQRQKMYDKLTSMNISPANIGTVNEKTLLEASFSPEELSAMPYYQQISQREGQRTELQTGLTNGQIPQPNSAMLRPLEEALKTKIGLEKEQLGQSELFSASGIDPYVALSRSLQERSKEMGDKYNSYANMMSSVGENLSASYGQALTNYKILQGQYDKEVERIDSTIKEEQAYKRQLDLMNKQQSYQDNPPVGSSRWYEKEQLKLQFGQAQREYEDKYGTTWDATTFKVGEEVGWCGDYASTISTATRVGDTWKEKAGHIDDKEVSVGDKLLIPMGVDKNGNGYGHVAVVLGYDPVTGNIQVAESNRDGRQNRNEGLGIATFGTYNINSLEAKYPGWGVAHGELKQEYANAYKGEEGQGEPGLFNKFYNQGISSGMKEEDARTFANKIVQDAYSPPTDVQSKAVKAYTIMKSEENNYEDLIKGVDQEDFADAIDFISRQAKDEDLTGDLINELNADSTTQEAIYSEMRWLEAALREESGAAISVGEYTSKGRMYFPRPGDSEKTLESKKRARETATKAKRDSLGVKGDILLGSIDKASQVKPSSQFSYTGIATNQIDKAAEKDPSLLFDLLNQHFDFGLDSSARSVLSNIFNPTP